MGTNIQHIYVIEIVWKNTEDCRREYAATKDGVFTILDGINTSGAKVTVWDYGVLSDGTTYLLRRYNVEYTPKLVYEEDGS